MKIEKGYFMKKIVSLMLAAILMCMTLTGCFSSMGTININEDGSGTLELYFGVEKEMLKSLSEMEGAETSTIPTDLQEFTYNETVYCGETVKESFKNIDELNSKFTDSLDQDTEEAVDTGSFKFIKNSDNSITLEFSTTPETGNVKSYEQNLAVEADPELAKLVTEKMVMTFTFTFPSNVTQTSGKNNGITIDGSKLVLDVLKMDNAVAQKYVFTTSKTATPTTTTEIPPSNTKFVDVNVGDWYYDAVTAMAEGGLVSGVGNDAFKPNGTLTYAQFCQILARAKNLQTGSSQGGYWAGMAIEQCIDEGYILSRGEISSKNYDVPITREAAISAMFLAKQASLFLPLHNYTPDMIPDFTSISKDYQENILKAYNYGITSGIDEKLTLNPQGLLTRAQVCKLFHNLKWTTPLNDVVV